MLGGLFLRLGSLYVLAATVVVGAIPYLRDFVTTAAYYSLVADDQLPVS